MKIDGSCHCGFITYEGEIDPEKVGVCHCTDCQSLTGSAFTTSVSTDKEAFKLLSGQPKIYVKTAESGAKRAQAFCRGVVDGVALGEAAEVDPQTFNLRVGTIRQRRELRPKTQSWCRSALDWVTDLASVPRNAQGKPR